MNQEKNMFLAKKAGYKFIEEGVLHENEYNTFEKSTILSKTELDLHVYEGTSETFRYFKQVRPYDVKKHRCGEVSEYNYKFLQYWNPDKNWNQLMEVAVAIGLKEIPTTINEAYNKIYNLATNYGKD